MGGHALRRIRHRRHRPVAQPNLVVGGHEKVVPWPLLTAGPIKPLQGAAHLSRWRGGVRTISEPWKRPRELPFYPPLLLSGLQSRQAPPRDPGNRVPPR